jgi:hypothetical protein
MALPSSGQLSLNDIRIELGLSQSNISLGGMSDTAGFIAPDAISDFYGYSAASVPTVTSDKMTVSSNSITANGTVTNNGGASITESGFVWSTTNSTPTIGGIGVTKTVDPLSPTNNDIDAVISGLSSNTLHYVRAYATNSAGTGYGSVKSVTTAQGITSFYTDTLGSSLSTQACSVSNINTQRWHNGSSALPALNDTVYTNSTGTTVFNGGNKWYRMGTNPFIVGTTVVRINSSGVVYGQYIC